MRPATEADIDRVAALHVASWRTAYRGVVPEDHLDALDLDERRELWRGVVARHPGNLIVAQDLDGAIKGFACAGPGGSDLPQLADYDGRVFAIHLDPAAKRQGLGRRLMQAAFLWMNSAGCKGAHLWVFADNAPARAFYAALGGVVLAQANVEIGGRDIPELAYGWRTLTLPAA